MKAKISLLIAICFISLSVFAQSGNDVFVHNVEPGQTLYFISKKYNLTVDEIRASNPSIQDDLIIKPGQQLVIRTTNKPVKMENNTYKVHIVQTKETLFSISKKYGLKVDDLIRLNNLESPNIQIGQQLKIKKLNVNDDAMFETPNENTTSNETVKENTPKETKKPTNSIKTVEVTNSEDVALYKQLFESYNKPENTLNKDKGIGNYLESNSASSYLAMVNNVPTGQIIKVRNLMNNKVIYLKVVGPISNADANNNISIKISNAAALDLNIIEDRFLAEWTWYTVGKSNEQQNQTPMPFDDF